MICFVSIEFLVFVGVTLLLYFWVPARRRWLVPLGISYYSFSLIGYMADVYWKKDKAEHNYLKLLLYMTYFPHILQGFSSDAIKSRSRDTTLLPAPQNHICGEHAVLVKEPAVAAAFFRGMPHGL